MGPALSWSGITKATKLAHNELSECKYPQEKLLLPGEDTTVLYTLGDTEDTPTLGGTRLLPGND